MKYTYEVRGRAEFGGFIAEQIDDDMICVRARQEIAPEADIPPILMIERGEPGFDDWSGIMAPTSYRVAINLPDGPT